MQADAKAVSALGQNDKGIAWTPSLLQYFVTVRDYGGSLWANTNETKFALNNQGAIQALTMLRNMVANRSMTLTQNYGYQLDFVTLPCSGSLRSPPHPVGLTCRCRGGSRAVRSGVVRRGGR